MSSDLIEFTERALSKGLERDEITQALRAAGWPKEEVAAALNAFAETDFPIPVPKPKPQVSARETFVQLLFFNLSTPALGLSFRSSSPLSTGLCPICLTTGAISLSPSASKFRLWSFSFPCSC